jgi:hypothetical protein
MIISTAYAQGLQSGGGLTSYTPWMPGLVGVGIGVYLARRKK